MRARLTIAGTISTGWASCVTGRLRDCAQVQTRDGRGKTLRLIYWLISMRGSGVRIDTANAALDAEYLAILESGG